MRRAVAVIITNEHGQILLAQRGPASRGQAGKWEHVGGELLCGETPQEGIEREVREELGARLHLNGLLHSAFDPDNLWYTYLFWGYLESEPSIQEPTKCISLKWVSLDIALNENLASFTRQDFEYVVKLACQLAGERHSDH